MMTTTIPPRIRLTGDDGSVIAEMGLVAPLIVLLMLGVFEFGTAWRNKTVVASALRSAARIESQNSTSPSVDQLALGAFYSAQSKLTAMTLKKVIIYEASGANGKPSASCLAINATGTGTKGIKNANGVGSCSVYSLQQVQLAALTGGTWGCGNTSNWNNNYCAGPSGIPDPRQNSLTAANGPDYVGVYAEYTYNTVTSLLPQNTIKITDYAVYRIEPAAT